MLDWNENAIRFYQRMGATVMPDWRICRIAGAGARRRSGALTARWAGRTDDRYAETARGFRWQVPERFNIAEVCCARWARDDARRGRDPLRARGRAHAPTLTYARAASATANRARRTRCARLGVARGDRVAIVMPQRFETAVAHIALYQLGAVAMPLSMLFGPEALEYRMQRQRGACSRSSTRARIANVLRSARPRCPALRTVIGVGGAEGAGRRRLERGARRRARRVRRRSTTRADEAAVLIYTSGTTGPPKGALIPHRALIGNLPRLRRAARTGSASTVDATAAATRVFWSPADWAWTGGLMDALLPTLYFGRPIVAYNGRFAPELAFELMQEHGVTHTLPVPDRAQGDDEGVPAAARSASAAAAGDHERGRGGGRRGVRLLPRRSSASTVNEMFGQTEINYIVGNCATRCWPGARRAAWAGRIRGTASR